MNTFSRRAVVLTGSLAFSLAAALAPHPARAQMMSGMGSSYQSPGPQNGRPSNAPTMGARQPMGGGVPMMGVGGGMPMRTVGPTSGYSRPSMGLPMASGMGYSYSPPMSNGPVFSNNGPAFPGQNYAPGYSSQPNAGAFHVRQYGNDAPMAHVNVPRSMPQGTGSSYQSPGPAPGSGNIVNPYYNPFGNNNYGGLNGGYTYAPVVAVGGPALLGGYYYGNYSDTYYGPGSYPAVYSDYDGFPQYIYSVGPGVTITTIPSLGVLPTYIDPPQSFQAPQYTVNYNQTNYYVTNEAKAADLQAGGDRAKVALPQAFPADSYQAALADIERGWTEGDLTLLKNHFRSDDTKISVFLRDKYKYSLNSSDFGQITRDAFDRLNTSSFKFTEVRKAKNGDVTGFGKHVYTVAADSGKAASGDLVPFDSSAPSSDGAAPSSDAPGGTGAPKTVYVSYTLRHGDGVWYIVGINSSPDPLAKQ